MITNFEILSSDTAIFSERQEVVEEWAPRRFGGTAVRDRLRMPVKFVGLLQELRQTGCAARMSMNRLTRDQGEDV